MKYQFQLKRFLFLCVVLALSICISVSASAAKKIVIGALNDTTGATSDVGKDYASGRFGLPA